MAFSYIYINKSCGVRFVDFVKVFDVIDHYFLLRRKSVYGLSPETLFKSFPADRKQTVYVNAATSDVRSLKYGVPQVSDLGPRLISIYINDCLYLSKRVVVFSLMTQQTTAVTQTTTTTKLSELLLESVNSILKWAKFNHILTR